MLFTYLELLVAPGCETNTEPVHPRWMLIDSFTYKCYSNNIQFVPYLTMGQRTHAMRPGFLHSCQRADG